MENQKKLVHGWKNGRPIVGVEGQVEEVNYEFTGHYLSSRRIIVSDKESYLTTGRLSNSLCDAQLNNLYAIRK